MADSLMLSEITEFQNKKGVNIDYCFIKDNFFITDVNFLLLLIASMFALLVVFLSLINYFFFGSSSYLSFGRNSSERTASFCCD